MFKLKEIENKVHFFEKFFLLANLSINLVFQILFIILNNIEINFLELKIS